MAHNKSKIIGGVMKIFHSKRHLLIILMLFSYVLVNVNGCANVVLGAMSAKRAGDTKAKEDAKKGPEMTQLQMRQLQTRSYDIEDSKRVLQVALAVLQDDGYVVENANTDLGLLTASKSLRDVDVDDTGTAFLKGFLGVGFGGVSSTEYSLIRVSVTVTQHGTKTRIRYAPRLSATAVGSGGVDQTEKVITEGEFYQGFFTKVEKGLFIEREGI